MSTELELSVGIVTFTPKCFSNHYLLFKEDSLHPICFVKIMRSSRNNILPPLPFSSGLFSGIKHVHIPVQLPSHPAPELSLLPKLRLRHEMPTPRSLPAASILFSVSGDLAPRRTSYKWNHPIFVLSGLASHTWRHVLKVHPQRGRRRNLLPPRGRGLVHGMDGSHLAHPFTWLRPPFST